jgi:superfamily II DNA or RNA helicase
MAFRDIHIKQEYRSPHDNIVNDFYIPILKHATSYKRAVGFFSSSALIEISKGISYLVQNDGNVQIVASPHLSDKDIEAIKKGYNLRDEIIKNAIIRNLTFSNNYFEQERLNLLANLIADSKLDIKVAITEETSNFGMYHEKMGIFSDNDGNVIAFSGSMNESANAFSSNYESIDVFCDWVSQEEKERVETKTDAFSRIWNNTEENITIIDFPELKDEIINRYRKHPPNFNIDFEENERPNLVNPNVNLSWFHKPQDYPEYYEYQIQAMNTWKMYNYHGIFDMATGTGKTLTTLGALEVLSLELNNNLGIIIVCPYQHLVEQWAVDVKAYGVKPIICFSAYDWKKKFKYAISDYSCGVTKNFCLITTNDTFATKFFQDEVNNIKGNLCLIVDEAHNFGARRQIECMKDIYNYRLALSATLERRYDEYGTNKLLEYFGKKCIEYPLERAIREDKLTPYYYYPIPVYFDSDELDNYNEFTEKISKILIGKNKESGHLPKAAEILLIKRARIIAGARGKLKAIYKIIKDNYVDDDHILVYCGATTVENSNYIEGKVDQEEQRQIEAVVNMLGNELGMRVRKFTSEENSKEREQIKTDFTKGDMLKILVAIRCLDEGVNIPCIRTAFILASSTNPKEYIQRRGRVLRKAPNKNHAIIYDFITLPRNIDEPLPSNAYLNSEYSLIKREYERMEDFAKLAENSSEVVKLKDKINAYYKLNYQGGKDYGF